MATRAPALLWWIVGFKVLKGGALLALGATLFATRRMPPDTLLTKAALSLHLPLSSRFLQSAMSLAVSITPRQEVALAITAIASGGLFMTEAAGLSRQASWARWLTVVATGCLVPLECYEIALRATTLRVLVLLVNVGVVVYLIRRKDIFQGTA